MSIIENISLGGVRFKASNGAELNGKVLLVKIRLPQLAPHSLELKAMVLSAGANPKSKISTIRAKFIDLSAKEKECLSEMEKIVIEEKNKAARINAADCS